MKYRAWLRDTEDELVDGRVYVAGPGLAAEAHAQVAYYRGEQFVTIRVNVRRIDGDDGGGHHEVLVFDVNVEMEPHFKSSLRSTIKGRK